MTDFTDKRASHLPHSGYFLQHFLTFSHDLLSTSWRLRKEKARRRRTKRARQNKEKETRTPEKSQKFHWQWDTHIPLPAYFRQHFLASSHSSAFHGDAERKRKGELAKRRHIILENMKKKSLTRGQPTSLSMVISPLPRLQSRLALRMDTKIK